MNRLYSNEIVFRGHPDKVCDQISDALLDAYLEQDEHSRCGIETVGGKGIIFITGEVTSKANVDVEAVTRRVLNEAGYDSTYRIFSNLGRYGTPHLLLTENLLGDSLLLILQIRDDPVDLGKSPRHTGHVLITRQALDLAIKIR